MKLGDNYITTGRNEENFERKSRNKTLQRAIAISFLVGGLIGGAIVYWIIG